MIEVEILSVKNMPLCKIKAEDNCTINYLKKQIEKEVPRLKVSRQSIRLEPRGKDIGNSEALSTLHFSNGTRLFVKDLGPQIPWTTVFLAEYFGPLMVYALFACRPQIIYGNSEEGLSFGAKVAWLCWSIHYLKRLFETVFIHRFSHGTMPLRNLFKNCSYYWGFAAFVAYHVNHPLFTEAPILMFIVGVPLFFICEIGNFSVHLLLRNLRPAGTSVRKIPVPDSNPLTGLFKFVSCPNYTYEFGAWLGFSLLTSCVPSLLFAIAGMYQMTIWALGKHKNYKKEFKDYPKQRKAILPLLL